MDLAIRPPFKARRKVQTNAKEVYSTSVAQTDEDIRTFETLCGIDQTKDDLIERLLGRMRLLNETLRGEIVGRRDERQKHDIPCESKLQDPSLFESRKIDNYYILLLINGDDILFNDHLLRQGEVGGKEAASLLFSALREHVSIALPDLTSNYKIIVRVYANVKGLAQVCVNAWIIDSTPILEDFVRGFNGKELYFDFVDAKDRADGKLQALLALHLGNHHCRQIILGVSHENGYAFQLEDVSNNPCSTAIYLLEGYPVEKDLSELKSKFKTLKFDRIFRSTKLSVHDPSRQTLITRLHTTSHGPEPIASRGADASLTTSTLPSYIATQKSAASSPSPKPAFLPISDSTKPLTWAKLASAAPPPKTLRGIAPLPSLSSARRSIKESLMASELDLIPRNIHGQRIDKFYSTTQTEWRRIQSLHLCNVHFLRQECTYGDKCTHIHSLTVQQGGLPDGSLTKRDLEILTQVSRYAPCRDGTACDDVNCTFGHRCPVLERLSHHGKRDSDRDCKHGKNCKFPDTMHVFDTRVVGLVEV